MRSLRDKSNNVSLTDFIFWMRIHWGKTLDAFENQHHSSLNMRILIQIIDFCIFVIPEAIFQAGAVNSVGGFDTLINISSGFCDDNQNVFFCRLFDALVIPEAIFKLEHSNLVHLEHLIHWLT